MLGHTSTASIEQCVIFFSSCFPARVDHQYAITSHITKANFIENRANLRAEASVKQQHNVCHVTPERCTSADVFCTPSCM
ncbi:uncharacterized protein PHALS_14733 [Plasmopara halstedii]|uniref:Uncharacterized protein n=1 Tax=Plasmopara halstedii TaxID=4781 RepID=A0A0P1A465_PLAHL|nr:uncharacterized protein PHALS_14733 [Plasmopara halstedii]CEG35190.1 hypothetical protein PHALS_14733 [Plasmopara halstedii]|eukprot:XP_024571559.1 hypothetical protein PHALS_14733 [Plasmopara halstedii]